MAKLSNDELLDVFSEMTLIELSEFVKAFEEKFDVTAAAPVAVAGAPAAGGAGGDAPAEEKESIIKQLHEVPAPEPAVTRQEKSKSRERE